MIICIEGPDGCGKTTVAEVLAKRLECDVIAFPNDAAFTGPMIRAYLRKEWGCWTDGPGEHDLGFDENLSALAFQALQVANRMELMPRIKAAHDGGADLVLCRYWQSAWVYGQLDGLPRGFLEQIHEAMVQPHVSILLDLDAETCLARRAKRDGPKPPERYEGDLARTRKIVELYRELWQEGGPADNWPTIDASRPFEDVLKGVFEAVDEARS